MNVKKGVLIICFMLMLTAIPLTQADTSETTPFADGSGTLTDPYQIMTIEELDAIHNYLDKSFILMNNLDFNDDASYANPDNKNKYITGNGWLPLGNSDEGGEFTGSFDGQQYTISNLFVNRSSMVYSSLFGYVLDAEISNLRLIDVYVTGRNAVGSFAGRSLRSSLSNCYAMGYVQGAWYYVGGLVGGNNGSISECYASVNITGNCYIGGLVGYNEGSISNSFATGDVIGRDFDAEIRNVGGLVGGNAGTILDSYAIGNVTGNRYVGGLTGCNWNSISDCYAKGNVTGIWFKGISFIDLVIGRWFLGRLSGADFGSIFDSYATGRINRRLFVEGSFWSIISQLFPKFPVLTSIVC